MSARALRLLAGAIGLSFALLAVACGGDEHKDHRDHPSQSSGYPK